MAATKPKRHSFDAYRKEADPSPDAFILDTPDGDTITIPYPGSARLIRASRLAPTDAYGLLEALCGDQTDSILTLVEGEPLSVLDRLVTDIREHFGLSDAMSPQDFRRPSS